MAQWTSRPNNIYYDQARLQTVSIMLCARIEDLFSSLGIRSYKTSKMRYGPCPVHGGANQNAFNLYTGGDVAGKWVCRSHHCEEKYKRTIIGFIRGVLSHQSGEDVPFRTAVDWACEFLGQRFANIKVDYEELEKHSYVMRTSLLIGGASPRVGTLSRADVRSRLRIPSPYFIKRGWSEQILDKFDIGDCCNKSKTFYNRAVAPVYDDGWLFMTGATARSHYGECEKCEFHHEPDQPCPPPNKRQQFSKWRNSDGFNKEHCLYGYWHARSAISRECSCVIVESPGNLWRLHEAGIENAVAMLGSELSDRQQVILETSGAMSVVIATDNDEPGRLAAERIKKQLYRSYRIFGVEMEKKDVGEMGVEDVKRTFLPVLERASK